MLLELFALAAAAAAETDRPIIVDGVPTIRIGLADYDLSQRADVRRVERRINWAANKVCKRQFNGSINIEIVVCARLAIADARGQLEQQLARRRSGEQQVASISISFPAR